MAARTEEQRAVGVAERRVVGVGRYGVGGWLLLGERYVVAHVQLLLVGRLLLGNLPFEKLQVVVRHGEVHVCLAVRRGVERGFHEVLLHWRAWAFGIAVEEQQALGQLSVGKALLVEQVGHDGLVFPGLYQRGYVLAVVFLALVVQRVVEGELADIAEKVFLEVGLWLVVARVEEGEEVLEHPACRSRRRHELHYLVTGLLVGFPLAYGGLLGLVVFHGDALAHRRGSLELEERESLLYLLELPFHLCHGHATVFN